VQRIPRSKNFQSAGVAVAGFIDHERSRMIYNPNLRPLEHYQLRAAFEARLGVPVTLDADSNAACFAEYRAGAGIGSKRFLCVVLGTGAGAGFMLDGQIVRLSYGGLGDLGHVIVDPDGPLCSAGCRGCLESVVDSPPEVLGRYLGIALASHATILFPDRIVIGGGRAEAGEALLKPARETFYATAGRFASNGVIIEKARLGWLAPAVGAAFQSLSPKELECGTAARLF
jgi:glucokinase